MSDEQQAMQYQDKMEWPMEALAEAMWGIEGPEALEDHEIVQFAARKIRTLKKMLLVTGFNEKMLKAIMEE